MQPTPQNFLWITFQASQLLNFYPAGMKVYAAGARELQVIEMVQIMAEYIGYRSLKRELPGCFRILDARAGKQIGGKLGKNREFYLKKLSGRARCPEGPWSTNHLT